jgi:hypothetical protein
MGVLCIEWCLYRFWIVKFFVLLCHCHPLLLRLVCNAMQYFLCISPFPFLSHGEEPILHTTLLLFLKLSDLSSRFLVIYDCTSPLHFQGMPQTRGV